MNKFTRTLLFLSALAPAVLVAALTKFFEIGGQAEVFGWIIASLIFCMLPLLIIRAVAKQSAQLPFSAKKVESQDWLLIVFITSYFIPLITKVNDLQGLIPFLLIAALLLTMVEAIPCHPVLHFFSYRIYKVEGTNGVVYTMITKRKILTAADIRIVRQISPQLIMEA